MRGIRRKPDRLRFRLRKRSLRETTERLPNPARGWYQIHTFCVEQEPDLEEQRWCLEQEDRLVLVLIDIGSYRDRPLDQSALGRIERILGFFAEYRYDCILRMVYDREGKGTLREPLLFSQVELHLRQTGELLQKYADTVFVFQGMLVGSWGEMHTSRHLSEEKLRKLAAVLREYAGMNGQPYLAVRRPVQWRLLHEEKKADWGMGLFDDGMFGSETHLGTFGTPEDAGLVWEAPWSREKELAFMGRVGQHAPNGGEAVWGEGFSASLSSGQAIDSLRRMKVTYLNRAYDHRVLERWERQRCPVRGVWSQKTVYDYVTAHLGYRFLLRRVKVSSDVGAEGDFLVEAEIENVGFAPLYQEAETGVIYRDKKGEERMCPFLCQMRGWQSGEARRLGCIIRPGAGALILFIRRQYDGAKIHLGNETDENGNVVLGYME